MTLKTFYRWHIEPWFKRRDQIWGKIQGTETLYKIHVFRWEKYVSPTIKGLGKTPSQYQLIEKRTCD